ncbi:MAG TPA: LytTR family DNA-binding domain-containing protein, partial [Opitutus sp.]|nr:LytTR family DNA-binding domain-containing protein [Opitutus sp.]
AGIVVVGEAGTSGRARTLLSLDNYDAVFLDIDLGHGDDGFDLLPHVRSGTQVVFVTAFDEHAVRAFEAEALDYLLKPVQPARLGKSLRRLRAPATVSDATNVFTPETDFVPVKVGRITRLLRANEIRSIRSCENYTEVTLAAGERLMVRRTMQHWADTLRSGRFARVHRNLIVNLAHIHRIERGEGDTMKVHFSGGPPLDVSRRYAPELRAKQSLWQSGPAAPGAIPPADDDGAQGSHLHSA